MSQEPVDSAPAVVAGLRRPTGAFRRRRVPVAGILRMLAVAVFLYAGWYQSTDFIGVLMLAGVWGVAAVGLGLVLGSAGQMWLCQASFVLVGAYVYGWLAAEKGMPTGVGLMAACLVGGALALAVSPVLRTRAYYLALATIALSLLIERLFRTGDWLPGGNAGLGGIPPLALGPIELTTNEGYLLFSIALLALLVAALHRAYGVGAPRRAIQAIHHDESLLDALGGGAATLKRRLLLIAGVLGGLAGGLYAGAFGFVRPDGFGVAESFALALAVFIGGNGRLLGAILGALIYQLSFVILGTGASDYRFVLLGAVVIVTMHFFPLGLAPSREDFAGLLPRRRRFGDRGGAQPGAPAAPAVPLGVSLEAVTKSYGALDAVAELTVEVEAGSLVGLVGPNGAGKTTMLDLIAGERAVTRGTIRLGADDVTELSLVGRARLGVGRTFQRVRLIHSLDVLDNVLMGVDQGVGREGRLPERERLARARLALAEVGLASREDDAIGSLAFGERRLVEMARVLASRPRLVLLDEPSSGLNHAESEDFAGIVRRLHGRGATVLLVEHNLPFVQSVAQRVIALDQGRLLAHGTTDAVFSSPEFQRAYVGVAHEAAA